ncbi:MULTISPECIES: ABC transporter ATP-binding protein [unclassified Mesorhizobium]|uniref:ABC transporter ATP-binding protein n=1 Tax=unclassified Mesorhizobium TaxID=325217 RepID=UPI001092DAC7|nr:MULTISPECIES: ABC transporter ATP-binding protein [unclassified Mesorhizobium]TGS43745.1 ABC transporter ATP-binding protein [Mesorhizobium sp. M8A.F.Ca.ET.182.01.1.1]TGS78326.1 ABC transporter ATP-binding protein [Mesorhizobium sp. M8A.F.Ca.ET.181.01.1.1]TGV15464.1 ABC transporter ATP-binding protein [Mesorhizobium sp. M8A.F.Ca.ET.173.01.1.1]
MSYLNGSKMCGGYNGVQILNGCSVAVDRGQVAVIVGPNGAGKSTAMKALLGIVPLTAGDVTLDRQSLGRMDPQTRVNRGISFVPQTDNIFPTMTVLENLKMGAYLRRDNIDESIEEVFETFPILRAKRAQLGRTLSGGQRQQLAVGRALMSKPTVLMLDEPTAGVSPNVAADLLHQIVALKERGLAILMVEQNARQALEIADIGYVLVLGENRFTGSGQDLLADPEVRRSFLGG